MRVLATAISGKASQCIIPLLCSPLVDRRPQATNGKGLASSRGLRSPITSPLVTNWRRVSPRPHCFDKRRRLIIRPGASIGVVKSCSHSNPNNTPSVTFDDPSPNLYLPLRLYPRIAHNSMMIRGKHHPRERVKINQNTDGGDLASQQNQSQRRLPSPDDSMYRFITLTRYDTNT